MGKASRNKGKRGEREACEVLRSLFPNVKRRAMQARGGSEGADLENTPGWHVEVGVGASVSPAAKLDQAIADARALLGGVSEEQVGVRCVSLTKRDRERWVVAMTVRDFVELVQKVEALQSVIRQGMTRGSPEESARISIEGTRCGWHTGNAGTDSDRQCTHTAGHDGECAWGLPQGALARVGP